MLQHKATSEQREAGALAQAPSVAAGKQTRSADGAPASTAERGAASGAAAEQGATRMEDWDADSLLGAMGLGEAAPGAGKARGLLVEDSAAPQPGQLTQTAFLAQLRAAVTTTASQVLGPTWSAGSCQDIPKLFAHYASLDAASCERVAARFAGVTGASAAAEYIAPICQRLVGAIKRWGAGEELSWEVAPSGLPAAAEEASSSEPKTPAAAAAVEDTGLGAQVQLKRSEGGGATADSLTAADLGSGQAMDSATAGRMGSAFGTSFDHVQVHTNPEAGAKTRALGADALAVGSHVAFAPGQYQPGTPAGDGLIAHELAHVMQQRGGAPLVQQRAVAVESSSAHEHDADQAAAAVVARLHGGEATSGEAAHEPIRPALATGTGVQRGNRPDIAATPEAMGQHMVEKMDDSNKPTSGNVHYWYNAKRKIETAKGVWKNEYRKGHHFTTWTDPKSPYFKQPDEEDTFMRFELKPRQSASAAVKAWLAGPTIGECLSAVYAMQSDTVRAAIGDDKFDEQYGSTDDEKDQIVRKAGRQLVIAASAQATVDPMIVHTDFTNTHGKKTAGDLQEKDYAALKPGEWYYFKNHPKYLNKHPGGAWQGENAIYMGTNERGDRLWAGLGAKKETEAHMYATMVTAYNRERNDYDFEVMIRDGHLVKDGGGAVDVKGEKYRYANAEYDPSNFPDTTDANAIKQAGGGFLPSSGWVLDVKQVQKLRGD